MVILLASGVVLMGCGGSDEASASTGEESSDTENASNEKNDESGKKGKGDKKGKKGEEGDEDEDKEEAVPVEVTALSLGDIEEVLSFSSNLEAESQVQVFSQAKRLITELLVEEGDRVRKGDVLLRLQDEEQRSALAKARSQLDKARREYEQQERLYKQELISEQVYNDATYELEQLQLGLEDAERELSYTGVTAPISGTITDRMINLGDQVQIGQHLFNLVDFDSIVARVYVPEKYLDRLRTDLSARISSASGAGRHTGRVKRIAPIVDPKSGTIKVTIDVGAQSGLRPGMYVDVDLVTATRTDAILVPKSAVIYDNEQMFVYRLVAESRVERVFIEPALTDKFYIEPISGLAEGDEIVVAGQGGLKDGALIEIPGRDDEVASDEAEEVGTIERAGL
jgi:membrane fusion protein (multidrug efflux system)